MFRTYVKSLLIISFTTVYGDLYNKSEPMTILNGKNLYDNIVGSKNGWAVEFYNSWCGHCAEYAPHWRNFSSGVKDWSHTFKVGVIDCADDENVAICREYEVMSYPTVRFFGAFTKKTEKGLKAPIKASKGMMNSVVEFLLDLQKKKVGSPTWVNLLSYKGPLKEIFGNASSQIKHAVIIVEEANSKVGRLSILDLGNYCTVYVRSMDAGAKELKELKLTRYPSVIVISRNGQIDNLKTNKTSREELTALIINHLNLVKPEGKTNTKAVSTEQSDLKQREKVSKGTSTEKAVLNTNDLAVGALNPTLNQVYMVDMENAISYAIRHEVMLHKTISGEALTAFKNFINVLVKYFPARPQLMNFLVKLKEYVLKIDDVLAINDLDNAVRTFISPSSILPKNQPWLGCQGSSARYRGYPCGLWTLFHTITVNASLTWDVKQSSNLQEPLKGIHSYVKYFFSCEYCSKHFQEMYSLDAESSVLHPGDVVIWLWKGHNKVNKRIKGELSEDPLHRKIQFPSKNSCPICRKSEETFDEAEVLKYLKKFYGRDYISLEGSEIFEQSLNDLLLRDLVIEVTRPSAHKHILAEDYDNRVTNRLQQVMLAKNTNTWSFTNTDVNLCVILYICSTLTIAAGYFMFMLKRRLRRKKLFDNFKIP